MDNGKEHGNYYLGFRVSKEGNIIPKKLYDPNIIIQCL